MRGLRQATQPPADQKILLVSSSGGVLLDLLALEPWWSRYDTRWAAVRAADTESLLAGRPVSWIRDASAAQPLSVVPSFAQAWAIVGNTAPDLIVSAGSGPAVGFFLVAWAQGIPTFWLSTLNVRDRPGIAARICARLASRVLLQHPAMQEAHPGGIVIGELY